MSLLSVMTKTTALTLTRVSAYAHSFPSTTGVDMDNIDDLKAITTEHNEVVRIERLTHHISRIREGMDEMKSAMKEMAQAMTRLALIEERQTNAHAAMDRMGKALDKVEERLTKLEQQQPMLNKTSMWVERFILAVAFAAITFVATKAGLL
jgi:methyl-accepting chemotaxis protein